MAAPPPISLRIVIVGDGGVGKSSITTSLLRREFVDEWDPTIEDSYSTTLTVDGRQYDVEIVDTAGQEEYRGMWGESTVRDGDGFIVTYSIESQPSFDLVPSFLHTIRKVKHDDDNPTTDPTPENTPFPVLLLGNKCDLPPSSRVISAQTGLVYSRSIGALFYECSAKQRVNIDSAFTSLVRSTAVSKVAREGYKRRHGGTEVGFNGNIALVTAAAASSSSSHNNKKTTGSVSPRVSGRVGRGEGGWEGEEDDDGNDDELDGQAALEKARERRKRNPKLEMDRRRSFSVGGLGADPKTLRDKEGGCCTACVIA